MHAQVHLKQHPPAHDMPRTLNRKMHNSRARALHVRTGSTACHGLPMRPQASRNCPVAMVANAHHACAECMRALLHSTRHRSQTVH